MVAGATHSFGAGIDDFWLVKTDVNGVLEWSQTYGGAIEDRTDCIIQTVDGGYALAGWTRSFAVGLSDAWLVKTDSSGNLEWSQTYGGTLDDEAAEGARSILQTYDCGYVLTGYTSSFGAGSEDLWLVKTDATGSLQWDETYGGGDVDRARFITQTTDGGYAIAGRSESYGAGDSDFWLIKLAPAEIPASVNIDPDTLNLKSKDEFVTVYIQLPECYNVADIALETVCLDGVQAVTDTSYGFVQNPKSYLFDLDGDGVREIRMVKFYRAEVIALLTVGQATLTLTGEVKHTPFEGTDTIKVVKE